MSGDELKERLAKGYEQAERDRLNKEIIEMMIGAQKSAEKTFNLVPPSQRWKPSKHAKR